MKTKDQLLPSNYEQRRRQLKTEIESVVVKLFLTLEHKDFNSISKYAYRLIDKIQKHDHINLAIGLE